MEEVKRERHVGKAIVRFLTNDKIGALLILVVMFIILTIMSRNFMTLRNILNLFRYSSPYIICGCGVLAVLMSGGMDMSTGATMGLAGMIVAQNLVAGRPIWLCILMGMAVGAVIGAFNGFMVGYIGLQPFISSMGTKMAVTGITTLICGGFPVNGLPEEFTIIGSGNILGVHTPIWVAAVICLISWYVITQTTFGRKMAACGGNRVAAKVSGINVSKTKWLSYIFCGVCSAIAGIVLTARIKSGQANTGTGYEMNAIAGTVIGGASMAGGEGTVFGCICGCLVMATMVNGMDMVGVNAYWQSIAQGLIIILAVALDILRKKVRA